MQDLVLGFRIRLTESDLVVDLLEVVRITDQHVLVDEVCPEMDLLPLAAADRERSVVLLMNPGTPPRRPKLRLHTGAGGTCRTCCNAPLDPKCDVSATEKRHLPTGC